MKTFRFLVIKLIYLYLLLKKQVFCFLQYIHKSNILDSVKNIILVLTSLRKIVYFSVIPFFFTYVMHLLVFTRSFIKFTVLSWSESYLEYFILGIYFSCVLVYELLDKRNIFFPTPVAFL